MVAGWISAVRDTLRQEPNEIAMAEWRRHLRGTLVYEKTNTVLGQKIHNGRRRDQDQGERCVNEGDADCHEVNEERDQIFARHGLVESAKLRLVMMMTRDRCAQEEIGKRPCG